MSENKSVFDEAVLEHLKSDLEKRTVNNATERFLRALITSAKKEIRREGIDLKEEGIDEIMTVEMYAAYLYRRRAVADNGMPRMLRYRLNQLIFDQHMATESNDG